MAEIPRRGSRVYQLFPESPSLTDPEGGPCSGEEMVYHRERLPSIVLEPTEQCDDEGEESRSAEGGQKDQQGGDGASGGQEARELQEEMEGSSVRKSSIGPVQSPMSSSRLTPPPSPTSPEAAPPCLRS
ncbi:hypothetical protein NHX12_010672 [Muraenolepis orangiensis]|uniref:Uncharacterized protein n=1 Tax=Muraenolepis orangiensis TaxID=630683 RepID=A0A9Q0DLP5_9TELE|nr:hypothetical protein NHX12_010672 [Muraenolepis orangiensis]